MIDLDNLKSMGSFKKYKTGEYICKEGEKGDEMYIVLSGKVGVYMNLMDGNPIKISEISSGSFFGEMAILEDYPRNADVITESDVIVIGIKREDIKDLIRTEPTIALNIMKELSRRVRRLNNELKEISSQFRTDIREESVEPTNESKKSICIRDTEIFPQCQKEYDITVPDEYNEFIYETEMECPICKNKFTGRRQRLSKLGLDRIEHDFRRVYRNFEPLWYNIIICPHCYYANYYNDFDKIKAPCIKLIRDKTTQLKGIIEIDTKGVLDINFVFASYYLAIYWAKLCDDSPIKQANLWMSLSWLYKDVDEADMYEVAYEEAFLHFYNAYYGDKFEGMSPAAEQQICLILGELYYRKGEKEKALKHIRYAIKNKDIGVESLNNQARNRIYDIKNDNP